MHAVTPGQNCVSNVITKHFTGEGWGTVINSLTF